jgi:predicted 3-demethylubiquinone-9 3-methyltransferase (glyoxalase superfamily)
VATVQRITPNLWFDDQAEEAAEFYVSVFPDSAIARVSRYGKEGFDIHHRPAGSAMTVAFRIAGMDFVALNGGPVFTFNEAVSFIIDCADQDEVDHYWDRLGEGGDPAAQRCGWLKDRYGVSWQIVPSVLAELMGGPDPAASERVTAAFLQMKKLVILDLEKAYRGG